MGFLRVFQNLFGPDHKPKSFKKGEKFDQYTKSFFPLSHCTLVKETPRYATTSKEYNEAALKPDFKFHDKKTNKCPSPLNGWTKLVNQFSHLNLGYGKNTQKLFCGTKASNHPGSGTKRGYPNHS